MPREVRRRGKKHKQAPDVVARGVELSNNNEPGAPRGDVSMDAPFGYVDPDLKAYFRTVDNQIQEWIRSDTDPSTPKATHEEDEGEKRRLFFTAALDEMLGNELALSTDPDCSVILERMLHSMDDFSRRVFMDKLSGSYRTLVCHRFASHVCQTCFDLIPYTISREQASVSKTTHDRSLRSAGELTKDAISELLSDIEFLVADPFAPHVLKSLFQCMQPRSTQKNDKSQLGASRSHKSSEWKSRQGLMRSILDSGSETIPRKELMVPAYFTSLAENVIAAFEKGLSSNELRALPPNANASPLVQILIRLEATVFPGDKRPIASKIIEHSSSIESGTSVNAYSDYVATLIRDTVASHVVEAIIDTCPISVFDNLWRTYFVGRLAKLSVHPVSNFIVARSTKRLDEMQLQAFFGEMRTNWSRLIEVRRGGVLHAATEASKTSTVLEGLAVSAVLEGHQLTADDFNCSAPILAISCQSRFEDYREVMQSSDTSSDSLQPTVQGSLLLQALLAFRGPAGSLFLKSIHALHDEDLLAFACHVNTSRVLDAVFELETVPRRDKTRLILSFIGRYYALANDRIGSRVAEKCWESADLFTKEKIARSLLPFQDDLLQSFYGRFISQGLKLPLFRRNITEWRKLFGPTQGEVCYTYQDHWGKRRHEDHAASSPSSPKKPRI